MKKCRFCESPLETTFCDLGMSPLSNSYISEEKLESMEPFYPLHAYVCKNCFLVQLDEFESPEQIFSDYAYFSSYSKMWLLHCESYVKSMIGRFKLNSESQVVEVASNDGYLLQYFKDQNIPTLGIEPAANVAEYAKQKGINTEVAFFGVQTAKSLISKGITADLALGNNVLAHVPNINDFVEGFKLILKPQGVLTFEFPHLLELMNSTQFDTIYHEHFSYLSLISVDKIFSAHNLKLFDVEQIPTHGGSLRIFVGHKDDETKQESDRLKDLMQKEIDCGLKNLATYEAFNSKAQNKKREVLQFLIQAKKEGKTVVGYGAPAKGNTLLNYCGVRSDMIDYTVDLSPHKQGRYLPGTHLPIKSPDAIFSTRPDFVFILPWNLKAEISDQMNGIRDWGGKFVTAIPELEIF